MNQVPEDLVAGPASGMTVHVIAATFPSRIQPWLLNAVHQFQRLGGEPTMLAARSGGDNYPSKIDRLGLLRRTVYLEGDSWLKTGAQILRRLIRPDFDGYITRRGAAKLLSTPEIIISPGALASAIRCIPALGLPQPSLLHAHDLTWGYYFSRALPAIGAPLVMTFHGLPPEGVGVLSEDKRAFLFRAVHGILVNTEFAKAQVESLGAPGEKVVILPQGLDLGEFPFQPTGFPLDRPVRILTVGRLHRDKGHEFALRALARLVARRENVEYRIVGVGPLRHHLARLAAQLGVAEKVLFLDAVDDETLRKEYASSDIFLLPSVRDKVGRHEETQGVVLQEAQAMGLMVVATRTGGIPECLAEGRSAILVPDRDEEAIAEAISQLIGDPERWKHWQLHGRRWVEDHFDADKLGLRLVEFYKATIDRARSV